MSLPKKLEQSFGDDDWQIWFESELARQLDGEDNL